MQLDQMPAKLVGDGRRSRDVEGLFNVAEETRLERHAEEGANITERGKRGRRGSPRGRAVLRDRFRRQRGGRRSLSDSRGRARCSLTPRTPSRFTPLPCAALVALPLEVQVLRPRLRHRIAHDEDRLRFAARAGRCAKALRGQAMRIRASPRRRASCAVAMTEQLLVPRVVDRALHVRPIPAPLAAVVSEPRPVEGEALQVFAPAGAAAAIVEMRRDTAHMVEIVDFLDRREKISGCRASAEKSQVVLAFWAPTQTK